MAGIIAQITRANRKRIDNKKAQLSAQKCNYALRPFERYFDPIASCLYIFITFPNYVQYKVHLRKVHSREKLYVGEYFSMKEILCYENRYILGKFSPKVHFI